MYGSKILKGLLLLMVIGVVTGILSPSVAFAKGTIEVTVQDNDGWGKGEATFYKWDNERRKYVKVCSKDISEGKTSIALPAGLYKFKVKYEETRPSQYKEVKDIQLGDREIKPFNFYFEKGEIEVIVTDNDGWGKGEATFYKWDNEKREYYEVDREDILAGKAWIVVPSGLYKVEVEYKETKPYQHKEITNIQIGDREIKPFNFYFEKGEIEVIVTDNDGWGKGEATFYKWDNEKGNYQRFIGVKGILAGKAWIVVPPGLYKVKVRYKETESPQYQEVRDIQIGDRMTRTFLFEFGEAANKFAPPVISMLGPLEMGNGDGIFEVGEGAVFRFEVYDDNFEKAILKLNDRVIEEFTEIGYYRWVFPLDSLGEYKVELIANDLSQPSNYSSWKCKFAVLASGKKRVEKVYSSQGYEDITEIGLIDRILDYYLFINGIDPQSEEANKVKRLIRGIFNPFQSKEEIQREIQDIINEILNQR